jgi:phosphoribosylanthranilate isomerase
MTEFPMKIKICGIKTFEDAMMCIEEGVDIIGFNFYTQSPRYISPGECMRLVVRLETALREEMSRVTMMGVFVNSESDNMHAIFRDCHLDMIQLSGDEPPEVLEHLGERSFKVLRPTSFKEFSEDVERYPRRTMAPAWMIDTFRPGEYGGTGQIADWDLMHQIAQTTPIMLAGGLTSANVGEAILRINPWGVDVASGVESSPGVKDPQKVRAFVQAVRAALKEHSL